MLDPWVFYRKTSSWTGRCMARCCLALITRSAALWRRTESRPAVSITFNLLCIVLLFFFIDISVFSFLRLCVHCLQLLHFYWRGSHAWLRVHMFRLSGAFVLVRCARVHPITIACLFTTNYQVKWVSYVTKCSVCCIYLCNVPLFYFWSNLLRFFIFLCDHKHD